MKLSRINYPGSGYYYVLCDVCGLKLRAKDAILITDKYNLLVRLLVCPKDADKTNPQQYLKVRKERQIENPNLIRSEATDTFQYISSVSQIETGDTSDPTGRAPTAPRNLEIVTVIDTEISLTWQGSLDSGSGAIQGYKIERENPVGDGFTVVVSDTQSVATYYTNTGLTASTQYNYKVSAINKDGTSDASNEANATTSAS